jgi:hypothetical protein
MDEVFPPFLNNLCYINLHYQQATRSQCGVVSILKILQWFVLSLSLFSSYLSC